uniref:EamA domain-containing protein n=2 Tax=Bursaphelenchus xylophilus TaxID=6326 RepID=A0A1I7RJI2_BURXY
MHLAGFRWLGMILVTLGLAVIGLCDMLESGTKENGEEIIFGDMLIVGSQILHAVQMVLEQSILQKYDVPPLLAVGLEGTFGMLVLSSLLVPMYYIQVPKTFSHNPEQRMEDVFFAFRQIREQPLIAVGLSAMIISIAFFNFSAVTTTKRLSATSRMVLDSVRTLIIWMVSIPLFGEKFIPLQILGFLSLILGMFVYNDVFIGPKIREKVLPNLRESGRTTFCVNFWGANNPNIEEEDELLIVEDETLAGSRHNPA